MKRSGIGKSALARLVDYGLCEDLPETSQLLLFLILWGNKCELQKWYLGKA